MLDFLLDTKLDCEQLEYTKIAQASGSALISLINDVLDMAKVESGHMELEIREFSIRDTLEDVLDVFRARLRESGVEGMENHYAICQFVYQYAESLYKAQNILSLEDLARTCA